MKFHIFTLFPEMIEYVLSQSIIGKAKAENLINIEAINIRDYTKDKHRHVDDYPYGGGAGMLMQVEPIHKAYEDICLKTKKRPKVLYMTPQGKLFNQNMAKELAKEEDLVFLCGHYEGVDERALEILDVVNISIGDYVLTGGELPAMVMIDSISRMVKGVLTNEESADFESFEDNLLEYPQYTRPAEYMGKEVPKVLLSGHHKNIEKWKREQSLLRTLKRRPELLEKARLSKEDIIILEKLKSELERNV